MSNMSRLNVKSVRTTCHSCEKITFGCPCILHIGHLKLPALVKLLLCLCAEVSVTVCAVELLRAALEFQVIQCCAFSLASLAAVYAGEDLGLKPAQFNCKTAINQRPHPTIWCGLCHKYIDVMIVKWNISDSQGTFWVLGILVDCDLSSSAGAKQAVLCITVILESLHNGRLLPLHNPLWLLLSIWSYLLGGLTVKGVDVNSGDIGGDLVNCHNASLIHLALTLLLHPG